MTLVAWGHTGTWELERVKSSLRLETKPNCQRGGAVPRPEAPILAPKRKGLTKGASGKLPHCQLLFPLPSLH